MTTATTSHRREQIQQEALTRAVGGQSFTNWPAIVAGFAATLCINVVNPDAVIARTNVARPSVDVAYLGSLGDDAVPTLLARLRSLDPPVRRPLARALLSRSFANDDVLSWNWSRAHARSVLAAHRAELEELAR